MSFNPNHKDDSAVSEQLIFDGQEYSRILFEKIAEAKSEILISIYILENDDFGAKVVRALQEKAKGGASVRLMVDGFGSLGWVEHYLKTPRIKNFEVRIFNPIPWMFSLREFFNIQKWMQLYFLFKHINRRNHQKAFIFDQKRVLLGSRNIFNNALIWRETSILFEGPAVSETQYVFENLWKRSHDSSLQKKYNSLHYKKSKSLVHILSTHVFFQRRKSMRALRSKIRGAGSRIYITTPYLYPPRRILRALIKKSKDGVIVKILVPQSSDVPISKWINETHYQSLLTAGITVHEYKPNVLHAKSMIIDDWALIASSNFNKRATFRDIELDYILAREETIQDLKMRFDEDIEQSVRVRHPLKVSLIRKCIAKLAIYFFPTSF